MQLPYYTACTEGEMLEVTKFKSRNDAVWGILIFDVIMCEILITTSISPSIQDVRELHALSPPLVGRYTL